MSADDLERHEDVFRIPRDGAGLMDDIKATRTHPVGAVHLDDVGIADALLLHQAKPVAGGAVERLTLAGDQAWDDLVEDRDLIGVPKLDDVRIVRGPDLLDFAVVDHLAHVLPSGWRR